MAETIATFQSQLSGVMETVFKAAMYEITRLVEDGFLEEMNRCREQVESLKKRLKWSESRRKEEEGDGRGRCKDCGRRGVSSEEETVKSLKEECMLQEEVNSSQNRTDEGTSHQTEEPPKYQSTQGENLDKLLKEEAFQITPESQERWGVCLEESTELAGTSKSYNEQKFHENPETSFTQIESGQDGSTGNPSDPRFLNRSGMENMGGFEKTEYGAGMMTDTTTLDGLRGSPSHLNESLSFMGRYGEDEVEQQDRTEPQTYQTNILQNRRGTTSSPAASPSRAEIGVTGEFSCLLINEEGFLQDTNVLYPGNASGDSTIRLSLRGQDVHIDCSSDSKPETYEPSDAYRTTSALQERFQYETGSRGARRQTCNQPSMSCSELTSPKVYKHGHKGPGQGPPYKCIQCGKIFSQASNFKVHQKIHSRAGVHFCSQCGKQFPSYNDQKTHECGQTSKPYCCSMCGKKFSRLWNLKLHWRIHTQEKPHRCTMCDKSFTRADILKVHQRTHTGERPYICTICGLSFKRLDHLKSHQRKHMTNTL